MHNLTLADNQLVFENFHKLFLIGLVFFVVLILLMVFLFGFSIKKGADKKLGVLVLALISISLPLFAARLSTKTSLASKAVKSVSVSGLEIVEIDDQTMMVGFNTSEPVSAYLEYYDSETENVFPILPANTLKDRTDHSFLVPIAKSRIGEAKIVIDGEKYLIDGKPIVINRW